MLQQIIDAFECIYEIIGKYVHTRNTRHLHSLFVSELPYLIIPTQQKWSPVIIDGESLEWFFINLYVFSRNSNGLINHKLSRDYATLLL